MDITSKKAIKHLETKGVKLYKLEKTIATFNLNNELLKVSKIDSFKERYTLINAKIELNIKHEYLKNKYKDLLYKKGKDFTIYRKDLPQKNQYKILTWIIKEVEGNEY